MRCIQLAILNVVEFSDMCGCSPVCKSFFETFEPPDRSYMCQASRCDGSWSRAVMAFLTPGPVQSQGLYGPLSENGSPGADHTIGYPISGLGTPRYSLWAGRPRRIPFQAERSSVDDQLLWHFSFSSRHPRVRSRLFRFRA